jgi:predicted nucleotidyltransferase
MGFTGMTSSRFKIPESKLTDFCRRYHVQRLALFGSALREDFHPDSDIDVLVVFDPSAKVTFMMLGKMKRELSGMFQRPVDLVPQEGLKPAIREAVLSSAQEVYAA